MNKSKYTYFDPTTLTIGGYKFALKKVIEQIGHDDTLPYAAILYINNKKVALIFNDGWGGETQYSQIYENSLLQKAEVAIKGLPYPNTPMDDIDDNINSMLKLNYVIDIADIIAYNVLSTKLMYKRKKDHIIMRKGIHLASYLFNSTNFELGEMFCDKFVKQGYTILSSPHILI